MFSLDVNGFEIAAGALIGANYGIATARDRIPILREAVEGTPTVLVSNGTFIRSNMHREGVDEEDVEMAIREHGIDKIKEVRLAILETDGSISVVQTDANSRKGTSRKRTRLPWRRG